MPDIKSDSPATLNDEVLSEQPDYSSAFVDGKTVSSGNLTGVLRVKQIGNLGIPSGKIVACDALVFFDVRPYTRSVPVGEFPVMLSVVRFGDDERVAYARVLFSGKATVKWEYAIVESPSAGGGDPEAGFGYPVDSGTGSFMDSKTAEIVLGRIENEDPNDPKRLSNGLIAEMESNRVASWDSANVRIPDAGSNIVIFSSGWGDGGYHSYFGLDEDGQVTELITDFEVVVP